ncbi:MAG: RNA repair domain-containing protein [Methanomassiliicoccales archaeon]
MFPRDVLNRLKWGPAGGLERARITYLHRGAPNDEVSIMGWQVRELGRSFFSTAEARIPYHRIKRIELEGAVLYQWKNREG